MMWPSLILLQLAAGAEPAPTGVDLGTSRAVRCTSTSAEEIVVCAKRAEDEQYRLRPLPDRFETKPAIATMRVGSATGTLHGDSAEMPGGNVSKRVMFTVKMPF